MSLLFNYSETSALPIFLGFFNSCELSWLVIWEAGIIIEIPAGVFVMYPSSLFFHFNFDMSGELSNYGYATEKTHSLLQTLNL